MKELVLKEIKTALSSCSLTLDGWLSDATEGYLGVTCHFIDNDFEFRSFILNLKALIESHSSEYIRSKIKEVIDEWDLTDKVFLYYFKLDKSLLFKKDQVLSI